jgi:hypothetical protein
MELIIVLGLMESNMLKNVQMYLTLLKISILDIVFTFFLHIYMIELVFLINAFMMKKLEFGPNIEIIVNIKEIYLIKI